MVKQDKTHVGAFHVTQATGDSAAAARKSTVAEGLYSGLVSSPFAAAHAVQGQMEAKLKLLVEAPAAVEDALASLLNHVDSEVQVHRLSHVRPLC